MCVCVFVFAHIFTEGSKLTIDLEAFINIKSNI